MSIRLGLCCKFLDHPIRFRSTTVTYLKKLKDTGKSPLNHLNTIVKENGLSLLKAIEFCSEHKIGAFRIGSDFLPAVTHPDTKYWIDSLGDAEQIYEILLKCKNKAKKEDIRLSFHPDQFVILSSPKPEVIHNSIVDLEYHGRLAELLGADVINIHGGGGYNNKKEALHRFANHFKKLSSRVQERLTVENDDRVYPPSELLPLCDMLGIPLVYDVHHHRCLTDDMTIEEASFAALKSWNREPLFHISSPIEGYNHKNRRSHHDYINIDDFPSCWRKISPLTIEVEAKAKEQAVLLLQKQL